MREEAWLRDRIHPVGFRGTLKGFHGWNSFDFVLGAWDSVISDWSSAVGLHGTQLSVSMISSSITSNNHKPLYNDAFRL